MIKSKKQMYLVIGIFAIILTLTTVTYAFFNYTRTGVANRISVGRIYFNSEQNNSINLTNAFPIEVTPTNLLNNSNIGSVTIDIVGDTTYEKGVEYLITAVDINNTINNKSIPISIDVSYGEASGETIGTFDNKYFNHRNTTQESIYDVLSYDVIDNNDTLVVGYIAPNSTGIDGTITIKAYLDKSKIAITDTYPESNPYYEHNKNMTQEEINLCATYVTEEWEYNNYFQEGETGESFCDGTGTFYGRNFRQVINNGWFFQNDLDYLIAHNAIIYHNYSNKTSGEWINSRVYLTTDEWNSLQDTSISFKVKVEANEGIWVADPQILREMIAKNAPTTGYIVSYDDFKASSSSYLNYTTQDTVGVNDDKQPVYYYTASDAAVQNSNVLFAGYCWQIVRTTDNGGVKLLYNGVAKKDFISLTTEALSDSDIIYTNDATNPYTYDSTTKKWASTNNNQYSSGRFIFKVKEAGDYSLNYIFSQQYYRDYINIYKNNTLIIRDEETNENTIDFNSLLTTDEIKIEMVRLSDGNSSIGNLSFNIEKITDKVESETPVCKITREATKAINGTYYFRYLSGAYGYEQATVFGRSFDYDFTTGLFTISDGDGLPNTWSTNDTNNNGITDDKDLIGTYTCGSNSNTCSTLYYVSDKLDSERANVVEYTISDGSHYSILGNSPYNAYVYDDSIARVGYMFNEIIVKYRDSSLSSLEYFATATWDSVNSVYVLSNGSGTTSLDANHRYRYLCLASNGDECFREDMSRVVYGEFIILENGETIEDAIYRMLGYGSTETKTRNANYILNKYNSSIKGYIDGWYKKNLIAYTNYLDNDAVYCNDRGITELNGWDPNSSSLSSTIHFTNYNENRNLNCINETDRFAVSNLKAKLTYPIGLLTASEIALSIKTSTTSFWTNSPRYYPSAEIRIGSSSSSVLNSNGVRPAITLKPGTRIEDGTGTYSDPYIVGPVVERDN